MNRPSRRSVLFTVAGAAAVAPSLLHGEARGTEVGDFTWMDKLTGTHRQVFDLDQMDTGLRVVRNSYDGYDTVFAPAQTRLIGLCQERGCTYEKV